MTLQLVLLVAAALFAVGVYGAISQQVIVMVMMGIEVMINAVLLAVGAFWFFLNRSADLQVLVIVVLSVMTVEMALGFAVATLVHRSRNSDTTDSATELSG